MSDQHRSSADYIDRTIETVRNHREADNCWPQWANIFADEIEDLRADAESAERQLAETREALAALARYVMQHHGCEHWVNIPSDPLDACGDCVPCHAVGVIEGDEDSVLALAALPHRGRHHGGDMSHETYETEQPWVIYRYLTSDRRTRITGRSRIECGCAVCGERKVLTIRIPRFGPVPMPEGGRHPARVRFLLDHVHPDRPHPMAWAEPLRNPAAHGPKGLDLDLLAMRLEAELRDPDAADTTEAG